MQVISAPVLIRYHQTGIDTQIPASYKEEYSEITREDFGEASATLQSIWRLYFQEKELLEFRGFYDFKSGKGGIKCCSIHSESEKSIEAYSWEFTGQFDLDLRQFPLSIELIHADERGEIVAIKFFGHEVYSLFSINEGFARGGKSHPYHLTIHLIAGKALLYSENSISPKIRKSGTAFRIKKEIPHYIVALKVTLMLERIEGAHTPCSHYNTEMRNRVEKINHLAKKRSQEGD